MREASARHKTCNQFTLILENKFAVFIKFFPDRVLNVGFYRNFTELLPHLYDGVRRPCYSSQVGYWPRQAPSLTRRQETLYHDKGNSMLRNIACSRRGMTGCSSRPCCRGSQWSATASRACTGSGCISKPVWHSPWRPLMCSYSGRASCPSWLPSLICTVLMLRFHRKVSVFFLANYISFIDDITHIKCTIVWHVLVAFKD